MNTTKVLLEWFRSVRLSQVSHLRAAAFCDNCNRRLGIPAVILSTIVGTSIFATLQNEPEMWVKIAVGLLSIAAAVLSSLQMFLKQPELAERHRITAAKYGELRHEIEEALASPPDTTQDWRAFLKTFRARWNAVNAEAPTCTQRIHDAALKHIDKRTPYTFTEASEETRRGPTSATDGSSK